ncbi:hypothetical protein [Marinobacter sp. BGYM27]|uniref:hypothetical protein n=1 Tax=Marinobacter sp. BGYM27 TaxID=2975597 RepID=UPI0021A829C2|nr:hypothetical protein [Marinobacter sp. BGYM27]MDG5500904.1 hypothetical protein [Marinobacter sp. BGYM27]
MMSSEDIKALVRKALGAVIGFVLAFVLLSALLIGGFVMLLKAASLGLTPWVGEAGAYGITGFACVLLLAFFFYRMLKSPAKKSGDSEAGSGGKSFSPVDAFRKLIINNPWEAVLTSFALGVTEQSDPRMRQFLIQSGLAFLKAANAMDDGEPENDDATGSGDGVPEDTAQGATEAPSQNTA